MKKILFLTLLMILFNINSAEMQAAMIIPASTAEEIQQLGYEASEKGFFQAAADGNIAVLNLFMTVNTYINIKDEEGRTPVYMAAATGEEKSVKYLLLCGADINSRTYTMKSPLMAAIEAHSFETAKLLIDSNASLNVADDEGYTPMHYAVLNNQLQTVKYMSSMYCDIDEPDNLGNRPLFYAVEKTTDFIRTLINAGANKDGKNSDGKTALHQAVIKNNFGAAKCLVEMGVNINIKDNQNNTPIFYAEPESIIYNYLLESGAKLPDKTD
ncbi:MAG: ankyrin repeat domain-containing protein [Candidatus Gastranaerophilaceae bacterium]